MDRSFQLLEEYAKDRDRAIVKVIRQMCLHCTEIPPEVKGLAVNWLVDHNYHLDMTE